VPADTPAAAAAAADAFTSMPPRRLRGFRPLHAESPALPMLILPLFQLTLPLAAIIPLMIHASY